MMWRSSTDVGSFAVGSSSAAEEGLFDQWHVQHVAADAIPFRHQEHATAWPRRAAPRRLRESAKYYTVAKAGGRLSASPAATADESQ